MSGNQSAPTTQAPQQQGTPRTSRGYWIGRQFRGLVTGYVYTVTSEPNSQDFVETEFVRPGSNAVATHSFRCRDLLNSANFQEVAPQVTATQAIANLNANYVQPRIYGEFYVDPTAKPIVKRGTHTHEWKDYVGLNHRDHYCDCGAKKEWGT
jgi:hypothetical protein